MDNITHSLIGSVIGLHFARRTNVPVTLAVITSIVANNFGDLDMLYAHFLSQPFGYILHHRGHTHTVIGALGCGILSWIVVLTLFAFRKTLLARRECGFLLALSIVGALVHIGLDSLNTYGVHPFWPANNRWYYGDTLFIIEPTLWVTLSLGLLAFCEDRRIKLLLMLPVLLGIGLVIFSGYVPGKMILIYSVITLLLFTVATRLHRSSRGIVWYLSAFASLLTFVVAGHRANTISTPWYSEPGTLTGFVSPSPANPLCWTALRVFEERGVVIYQRRIVQPLSRFVSIACAEHSLYPGMSNDGTPITMGEIPQEIFHSLADSCRWAAFRRFARVPAVHSCGQDRSCTADLRYGFGRRGDFTTFPLDGDCPTSVPPWEPPIPMERL